MVHFLSHQREAMLEELNLALEEKRRAITSGFMAMMVAIASMVYAYAK